MATSSTPSLKEGATGDAVRTLQTQLNQLGYGLEVTGVYDKRTKLCVRHLQKAFNYDVDGIVGEKTRFLVQQQVGLNWHTPVASAVLDEWSVMLKRGAKGDAVKTLQTRLNKFGYGLTADGDFGARTEAAVKDLQAAHGYTVDGIVGEGTHFLVHQQLQSGWRKPA